MPPKPAPYVVKFQALLNDHLPEDASYVFICQRPPQQQPSLIHNIDGTRKEVAKVLRSVAAGLEGDA